jgi:DNA-binding NtrC family response regulator
MAAGVLRPDLYYRLSSSSIHVPPLRGRLEDVPLLAEHCLAHVAEQQPDDRRVSYRLSAAALATLQSQHWPGNVRELFNVLEDACAMCSGDEIDTVDLSCGRALAHVPSTGGPGGTMPTLAAAERALIERAIAMHRGNKLKAARQLGISRTKLYAKLAKYGLG